MRELYEKLKIPIIRFGPLLLLFAVGASSPAPSPIPGPKNEKDEFQLANYGRFPFRSLYGTPNTFLHERPKRFKISVEDDLMKIYAVELQQINPNSPNSDEELDDPKILKIVQREFLRRNQELLDLLQRDLEQTTPAPASDLLTAQQAEELRTELESNAITGPHGNKKYNAYGVGYCFGRAALVHFRLSKAGLRQEQMAKIFVFGLLLHRNSIWKYHMATLVKGVRNGEQVWWVIDSLFPKVMDVQAWTREVSKFSVVTGNADIRFYASAPEKFLPSFGEYSLERLQRIEYRGYFESLGKQLLSPR